MEDKRRKGQRKRREGEREGENNNMTRTEVKGGARKVFKLIILVTAAAT